MFTPGLSLSARRSTSRAYKRSTSGSWMLIPPSTTADAYWGGGGGGGGGDGVVWLWPHWWLIRTR